MNILRRYKEKYGHFLFTDYMRVHDKEEFDRIVNSERVAKYIFKIDDTMSDLTPGDYVVVDCSSGLKTCVFLKFTTDKYDIEMATRHAVCKIANVTVFNYRK